MKKVGFLCQLIVIPAVVIMFVLASILLAFACHSKTIDLHGLTIEKGVNKVLLDGPNLKDVPQMVDVTDLGDLVTRMFWGHPIKEENPIKLDHTKTSDANLMVVTFGAEPLDSVKGLQRDLDYNFFPADPVSLLTSLVTSRTPNHHGVVARQWFVDDKPVDAFSTANSFSSYVTFPELVGNAHPETKVLTSSSDPQLATAFAQNSFPIDTKNNEGFRSSHNLGFTNEELFESIKTNSFWKDLQSHVENLDHTNSEVVSFLKDIEYIRKLHEDLKQKKEEKTEKKQPTLYNIAVKSPSSPDAHHILKKALSGLKSIFHEAYPSGSSQIISLQEPQIVEDKATHTVMPLHHKALEFSEVCTNCKESGTVISDSRGYQIGIWIIFFMIFFLYMYIDSMAFMDYAKDATLFTTWVRSDKSKRVGNMNGQQDMRAFNIRN